MGDWADRFFEDWQQAWSTDTDAVMEHVTEDIEYWDATLPEPIHGAEGYREYVDGFFRAFSEIEWSLREPLIEEGDRVAEPWRCRALNSGPLSIGLPATGKRLETLGTGIFEFRDGKVCREHSFYDVQSSMRQLGLWPPMGGVVEKATMSLAGLAVTTRRELGARLGG